MKLESPKAEVAQSWDGSNSSMACPACARSPILLENSRKHVFLEEVSYAHFQHATSACDLGDDCHNHRP